MSECDDWREIFTYRDAMYLEQCGYRYVESILDKEEFARNLGGAFSERKAQIIFDIAKRDRFYAIHRAINRRIFADSPRKCLTGDARIDSALQGGVARGEVTLLHGFQRSHNVDIPHELISTSVIHAGNTSNRPKCIYIDVSNSFGPCRILAIAKNYGVDGETLCDNIIYGTANDARELCTLIEQAYYATRVLNVVSVIVDTVDSILNRDGTSNILTRDSPDRFPLRMGETRRSIAQFTGRSNTYIY